YLDQPSPQSRATSSRAKNAECRGDRHSNRGAINRHRRLHNPDEQSRRLPIPVIFLVAVALVGAFLTANTTFGRYLYAIGGNPDAARLSGINLKRYILAAFCLMGALAGLASLLHTARVGSASPDAGTLMELDAIASCVIGGTSLMGGRGTVFGAVLGALILSSLDNGMSLLNVENWAQYVVKGGVLVAAVG